MRQFANIMNIFLFIFLYFEPLHSHGSEPVLRNSFSTPKISATSSNNGGTRDPARYTTTNANHKKAVTDFIKKTLTENVTAAPRAMSLINTSPSPNPRLRSDSSNFAIDQNETTNYYKTHVENYPDYAEIAPKLKKFQGFRLRDVLPPPNIDTHTLLDEDADNYRHLCSFKSELIEPREITNKANKPVKVVNYDAFKQIIHAESCWEKNTACSYSENFPNNLKPICKQNYIFRTMVTMNDNNEPNYEDIPIPASCICVLKDMTLG